MASAADSRFGKVKFFIMVIIPIQAGIRQMATRRMLQIYGVDSLINSNVGPKAFSIHKAGDIKVYVGATGSVKNATEQFISRKFECLSKSNVEGHWM